MNKKTQLQLAKNAGKINLNSASYDTWLEEYEYHLGMVDSPLLFGVFKHKFEQLNQMFDADPDEKITAYDKPIMNLCNQLGY